METVVKRRCLIFLVEKHEKLSFFEMQIEETYGKYM